MIHICVIFFHYFVAFIIGVCILLNHDFVALLSDLMFRSACGGVFFAEGDERYKTFFHDSVMDIVKLISLFEKQAP